MLILHPILFDYFYSHLKRRTNQQLENMTERLICDLLIWIIIGHWSSSNYNGSEESRIRRCDLPAQYPDKNLANNMAIKWSAIAVAKMKKQIQNMICNHQGISQQCITLWFNAT